MIVHGLDGVVLGVGDLGAARAYYGKKLGLTERSAGDGSVVYDVGDPAGPGLVVREQTGVEPGAYPRQTPRVRLRVPDARAQAEAFRADGLHLVAEPSRTDAGWVVEVADDWGNVLGFADETERQP